MTGESRQAQDDTLRGGSGTRHSRQLLGTPDVARARAQENPGAIIIRKSTGDFSRCLRRHVGFLLRRLVLAFAGRSIIRCMVRLRHTRPYSMLI